MGGKYFSCGIELTYNPVIPNSNGDIGAEKRDSNCGWISRKEFIILSPPSNLTTPVALHPNVVPWNSMEDGSHQLCASWISLHQPAAPARCIFYLHRLMLGRQRFDVVKPGSRRMSPNLLSIIFLKVPAITAPAFGEQGLGYSQSTFRDFCR